MSELSTPLERAVRREDIAAVEACFQSGHKTEDHNHLGIPVLFDALKTNNLALLECFQRHRADLNHPYNHQGYTPLIYASLYCDTKTIAWLLNNKQDIKQRTAMGISVMHVAVQRGDLAIVEFLYQRGADAFSETLHGETPLLISLKAKNGLPVFKFLLRCYKAENLNLQPKLLSCLAYIFEKQQNDADKALQALLPYIEDIPSEESIREYMALPGNYASSPLRSLQSTLNTRLSASLFALLKSVRIRQGIKLKSQARDRWHGPGGL